MLKIIRRGLSLLLTGLLIFLLASGGYTLFARKVLKDPAPRILGHTSAVVVSGSMSGAIEMNDMIFTKACDDYAVGDIIMFVIGKSAVTHRIVERTEDGFVTKGDANNAPDPEMVSPDQIVGKVVLVIPKVGLFVGFVQTPAGFAGVGALLLLISLLPGTFEKKEQRRGKDENENE